ncbi:MAG TPA: hypothetical protein VKH43_07080 [Thermoanaerobaculia bacterium]|nr:hypothetical protein [Thermoanaerobaculia bacterium]
MRWPGILAGALLLIPALAFAQPEEPFRPKGAYNNAVHRFHPDLDARLNAVRYGRWRALQVAWKSGINERLDREVSEYLQRMLADPPRFSPEADRVAPAPAREAAPIFRALRWGGTLEQQFLDILASADATPQVTESRVERSLTLYRRDRFALSEPAEPAAPPGELFTLAPISARILSAGTRLAALAAADLVTSDFAEQRWKVRKTVLEFDPSKGAAGPGEVSYSADAPAVASAYPLMAAALDRLARFRIEVFAALIPGAATPEAARQRDERLRAVARRYGLPVSGIGE